MEILNAEIGTQKVELKTEQVFDLATETYVDEVSRIIKNNFSIFLTTEEEAVDYLQQVFLDRYSINNKITQRFLMFDVNGDLLLKQSYICPKCGAFIPLNDSEEVVPVKLKSRLKVKFPENEDITTVELYGEFNQGRKQMRGGMYKSGKLVYPINRFVNFANFIEFSRGNRSNHDTYAIVKKCPHCSYRMAADEGKTVYDMIARSVERHIPTYDRIAKSYKITFQRGENSEIAFRREIRYGKHNFCSGINLSRQSKNEALLEIQMLDSYAKPISKNIMIVKKLIEIIGKNEKV